MHFGVLGPLVAWTSKSEPVSIPETRVRALLADLLVHEGRPVSPDRLVDDLWGADLPGNPSGALQHKVWQLRRALERAESGARALIVREPAGYSLRAAADAVDAYRFTSLTERARATDDHRERVALLTQALDLWRGPAFADFRDSAFAREAISRLDEHRLAALEELAEARLELGEHRELPAELAILVDQYPLRERLRATMMRALYRSGRQSEALASYRELQERLADELGIDPGREISELHRTILTQERSLDVPSDHVPERPRTNLPVPLTELVGRDQAVSDVQRLLETTRLVTLTGPGGVGKTRLAIAAAAGLDQTFYDGIWLVDMTSVDRAAGDRDDEPTTAAVMNALGIGESISGGGHIALVDRLIAALRTKETLLVIDNCEHVVEELAKLADALLQRAPRLRILATSQEPLGLTGEATWVVPPLDVPTSTATDPRALERFTAVQLFAARAAAGAPGFVLSPESAGAVAAICQRLDGLPLALELAATRVRALGVHELAARLDDRFSVLSAGLRNRPSRQQTLRAMIDWSWALLSTPERVMLRRLAVHAGGCTLAAAENICAGDGIASQDVAALISSLVERSLVIPDPAPELRYRLLESVAAYATEKLHEAGEFQRLRQRHSAYYAELAQTAEPHLRGRDQHQWLDCLDADSANIQQALAAATDARDAGRALSMASALTWYWFIRGRLTEADRSLDTALAVDGEAPPAVRATAMACHAAIMSLTGRAANPARHAAPALALDDAIDDAHGRAMTTWLLGYVECDFGDLPTSKRLASRALDAFRSLGDRWGTAAALSLLAKHAAIRGDVEAIKRHGEESLALFRELGDRWGQVDATEWLGELAEITGDYDRATLLHTRALHMAEELGLWPQVADRISWLGRIAMLRGDQTKAFTLLTSAARLSAEHSYRPGQLFAEIGLGLVERRMGKIAEAESRLRGVLAWIRQMDTDNGAAMTMILPELGFLAEQRGDASEALRLHLDGLDIAVRLGDQRTAARAVEGLAAALAMSGHPADTARLLGTATSLRKASGTVLPAAERVEVERVAARTRDILGIAAFNAEFQRGTRMTAEEIQRLCSASPAQPLTGERGT